MGIQYIVKYRDQTLSNGREVAHMSFQGIASADALYKQQMMKH
jgi:hypothetical protein